MNFVSIAKAAPTRRALGLRARLTLIYVGFFTLLILVLGVLFRQTLQTILHRNASQILAEEWGAVKGYFHVDKGQIVWTFDREDQEERTIVEGLQKVFLLTDKLGKVLQASEAYKDLGVEPLTDIQRILRKKSVEEHERRDEDGVLYLIRSGLHVDDGRREFFLSIARSREADEKVVYQFTRQYFSVVPLLIFGMGVLGWIMSGRALGPLNEVAQAARSITSESLSVRLNKRGAGDELDNLVDSFNSMVDRIENSFNQIRQFSTDVSHELRTPLTAIRGQLEVALFTAKTHDQYRDAIGAAIEDVDQLAQVVRTLLHLSQAESGQVALAREPVELDKLAERVLDQFHLPAEAEGIQLQFDLQPAPPILGDKIQLERMISNLLSNAIKYTGAGGRVKVRVHGSYSDGVELVVEDTGRGIPAEHLPHIFDRFYRVPDGSRNPERGLGLGLSFVNWIARAHNARIHVESQPGIGTRFVIGFAAEPAPLALPGDWTAAARHGETSGAALH